MLPLAPSAAGCSDLRCGRRGGRLCNSGGGGGSFTESYLPSKGEHAIAIHVCFFIKKKKRLPLSALLDTEKYMYGINTLLRPVTSHRDTECQANAQVCTPHLSTNNKLKKRKKQNQCKQQTSKISTVFFFFLKNNKPVFVVAMCVVVCALLLLSLITPPATVVREARAYFLLL